MSENNSSQNSLSPLYISIALVIGMLLGSYFLGDIVRHPFRKNTGQRKWAEIMSLIDKSYVDSVNVDSLAENSIKNLIAELDPHTYYFAAGPKAEVARTSLSDGFEGIGVEYLVLKDTIQVMAAVSNGPAETAGILAGDKILKADTIKLTGSTINPDQIYTALRGKKGSEVTLKIKRLGLKNALNITVKRGVIPNFTVPIAFMLNTNTGYIKIDRFGENTYKDFLKAGLALKNQNMTQLILDLRGNPGGYMDRAIKILDEFIAGKKLLLYTDGKGTANDEKFFSELEGSFENQNLIVLVDKGSASASEIVAGALQDHDRALVIGSRTFGKGLVQSPISLSDGSELRLTISRYYTPSGRSVQRPYTLGKAQDYNLLHLQNVDSTNYKKQLKYKTTGGRTVLGGGGVVPDITLPVDSNNFTKTIKTLIQQGEIQSFFFGFSNKLKSNPKAKNPQFVISDKLTEAYIKSEFEAFLKSQKLAISAQEWQYKNGQLLTFLKYQILKKLFKKTEKHNIAEEYWAQNNEMVKIAMQNWPKAQAINKIK